MISFLWPWMFLLLPMPLLVRWLLPAIKTRNDAALRVPFYSQITKTSGHKRLLGRWDSKLLLPLFIWTLLIATTAQPIWLGDDRPHPTTGRDLILLIDISGSMRHVDFRLNEIPVERLEAVKSVASEFIDKRRGDRLGLILFGSKPFLRAPLSHDSAIIKTLLQEAEIALAGEYTAIGDAIGLGIKRMHELNSDSRVMVLLTDGANNEGLIPPNQAANIAASKGIRIYTISVGAVEAAGPNPFGVWSTDNSERFEREVLEEIARTTNGHFFHASDTQGLQQAYDKLNLLEPALGDDIDEYISTPLFTWTLIAALLLSVWHSLKPWLTALRNQRRRDR